MAVDVERIIAMIRETGNVEGVGPDDDFYEAGFSSVNALNLLLELEAESGASIPDDRFVEARTPRALATIISGLS